MGDPKKLRKKYSRPPHLWKRDRIAEEKELKLRYGLKNMREIWRAKAILGKFRKMAKELLDVTGKEKEKNELLSSIKKFGIEVKNLDDVLALKVENLLDRRLQTILHKKGLAKTIKQARQFIVHGHVLINDKVVNIPSYLVLKDEEDKINLKPKVMKVEKASK